MSPLNPDLLATFAQPELRWLLEKIRQRLELGKPLGGVATLRNPTEPQRLLAGKITGRVHSGPRISVDLAQLEKQVQRAHAVSLADVVQTILGRFEPRASRGNAAAAWKTLCDPFRGDRLRGQWLDSLLADGVLRRLASGNMAAARELLGVAERVLVKLPGNGIALTELAATVAGDSHALDLGRPLHTLVVRYLSLAYGADTWSTAEARRGLWAEAGVLCDELSAPVLFLNLRALPGTPTADALNIHASAGEPYRLSVRQLLRNLPAFESKPGAKVFVCENPTVVSAAANVLGASSAPLVCMEGQPKTAATILLRLLARSGFTIAYHGDFDWGGIRIGNELHKRHGFTPWRFTTADYRAAPQGKSLFGRPVEAAWDSALAPAMQACGTVVHEEAVIEELLGDLRLR